MATVSIPLLLKDVTGGTRNAEVDGTTLAEVIDALDQTFPGFAHRILNGDQLSPTVAVTVDGKIAAGGLSTPVCPDSRVNLLPAFGGG
ncbi:MAG: MoaD/ThiS family protein [Planctomycetes bacterium]|nr:MoaD/ThiS family protein [Planctomycetota bacterium]